MRRGGSTPSAISSWFELRQPLAYGDRLADGQHFGALPGVLVDELHGRLLMLAHVHLP
jgi:hypothetical protein